MTRSTHIRVEKELLAKQKILFPEYKPGEIYKIGFSTLKKINAVNDFIYGKKTNVKTKKE